MEENDTVKINDCSEATYIQETDEYTSGYALRVPKIVRFRPDKKIEEIDSIEKLHKLYEMQYERHPFKACDLFIHFHSGLDGEGGRNPTI